MPSGDLHAELNLVMGVRDPSRRVQKLVDSTAKAHGPAHRHDAVHSLGGAIIELANRGELTPENALAVVAHINQDRAFDAVWRALPIKGPLREFTKTQIQKTLVKALREARKRRA